MMKFWWKRRRIVLPEVASILKTTMEQAGQTYLARVPVVADVRIASSWATS